jgi:rod shape-determining protein MreC
MRLNISKPFLITILVFFLVMIFHYSGILFPVENLAIKILGPVGSGFYNFGGKVQSFFKPGISAADYEKVLAERDQLIVEKAELLALQRENEELRTSLNFKKEKSYDSLMANILGRDPNFSNYFILNKGLRDGVEINLPVVSPEGILVGKILKVEDRLSVMLIPTDTNFQTAAAILGKTKNGTSGLVHGEKGLGIKMEFIPQEEEISRDDIVVTSGLELNMREGLVIGRVAEVKRESRDIFGEATVSPLAVYENLDTVMILLPGKE